MDKKEREEVLKQNIYDELSNSQFAWNSINSIVEQVGSSYLMEIIDIDEIMKLPNSERFFSALLKEEDNREISQKIAQDSKYQKYFFEKLDNIYGDVARIEPNEAKNIIRNIGNSENIPNNMNLFLSSVDSEVKGELLKEDLNDNLLLDIAKRADKNSLQDFITNNPKALTLYSKIGINKMIDAGIEFPKDILRQPDFFEQLKGKNMVEMRRNINRLYKNNYSYEIERKVNEYRESIINDYNPEKKIFNSYDIDSREDLNEIENRKKDFIVDGDVDYEMHDKIDDSQGLQEYLKETTREKMSEVIMDSLFNDTKNNVKINIEEMIRYCGKVDQQILKKDDLTLYNKFRNIDELDSNQLLEMYNELKDENMTSKLYTDISALRQKSHEDIANCLFSTDKSPEEISISDTQENGIEMYKLQGKPFYMLVRKLNREYRKESHNEQSSYSLISGNNTHVFEEKDVEEDTSFLYGYGSLEPESIVNVFEKDSYTTSEAENTTLRPNRIMTPEEIADSENYSEINIKNKLNPEYDGNSKKDKYLEMEPSYIVAMDKVTQRHIDESKRLGIPVVVIDRERYKESTTKNIDYQEYDIDIN